MQGRLQPFWIIIPLIFLFSGYSSAESGTDIFKRRCAGCHGANGAGDTTIGKHLKVRDLRSPEVQKQSDEELAAIISKGTSGKMPAFESKLNKEQIEDVVKLIRTLKR